MRSPGLAYLPTLSVWFVVAATSRTSKSRILNQALTSTRFKEVTLMRLIQLSTRCPRRMSANPKET